MFKIIKAGFLKQLRIELGFEKLMDFGMVDGVKE